MTSARPTACCTSPPATVAARIRPDPLNTGQDCSDLLSSIIRIDADKGDDGKNYAVPKDNPFVGMKDVRPEIWAFGFRNPYRMS
ncbi:MAG: PQQ-dependent sugar dehydrogenase [Gemmataceae bacterium]